MKSALYQIVYTNYKTSTDKDRVKKQFIFLEEFYYTTSLDYIKQYKTLLNRYKNYNNIVILEYDTLNNGYIFNKTRNTTLLLNDTKGLLQDGYKINIVRSW